MIEDIRPQLKTLIDENELQARIRELAQEISNDYYDKLVTLVCVLKGSIFFMVDLAKHLDLIFDMEFLEITSYGNERESSGIVKMTKDLRNPVTDKHVIIIEDILDSGRSLEFIRNHIATHQPASIAICTLLDKPAKRVVETIKPDYTGFVIPDKFVVGYGLDYCEYFRNINYIGTLN